MEATTFTSILPSLQNIDIEGVEANYASKFSEILIQMIQEYDNNLGEEFEVGLRLVSFSPTIIFAVHSIGFQNPSLIVFTGIAEDGSPIELIQHVTQISFLLTSLYRKDKDVPKRRIGFNSNIK